MKRFLKIMIVVSVITLILSNVINADEGFWTNLRVAGGSYYSKVEHPDITLEKELLKYCGNSGVHGGCEVYFLFKNTNQHSVSVKVGFPVKIVLPLIEEDLDWLDPASDLKKKFAVNEGPYRKLISWQSFEDLNSFSSCDIFPSGEIVSNLTIIQDSHKIDIDSVLVECDIVKPDTAIIQFHFLHQLDFQPDAYSNVLVKYSSLSSIMSYGAVETADYINWSYILGTGKTWKGPIKTIYFLVLDHLKPELPESFNYVGDYKQHKIFMAENYEPLNNDQVNVRYVSYGWGSLGYIHPMENPKTSAQSYVALKSVSSYLQQKTWINSDFTGVIPRAEMLWEKIFGVWNSLHYKPFERLTPSSIIEGMPILCENIDFGPLSLFDGLPESAWCEGVNGDGIGEWVEFELKEEVLGIASYNGFTKCPEDFLENEERENASKILATYTNNNRVKLIEFISEDGQIKQKVRLLDSPERQVIEDIYLPRGVYKLYIRDIYKGTKWDDTCLGEIEFYSASARGIVEQDEFFKKVFHGQPVQTNYQNETEKLSDAGQESSSTLQGSSSSIVIVWSTSKDIYAQRYSSNGVALGNNFRVTDDQKGKHIDSPCTAVNGNGNFVVTWLETRNDFNRDDIYAQRFSSDGTALGSNFRVNDDQGYVDDRGKWQRFPAISIDGSGNFVVTWQDTRNSLENGDIYAQRYASDGTALGRNFRVNDTQGNLEILAETSVSMDMVGNFVITWDDNSGIWAQRYSGDGTAIGQNFRPNDDPENASVESPSVSTDESGNFVIAWVSHKRNGENAICAQRYSSNGTTLGPNFKVSSLFQKEIYYIGSPAIATDKRGNFIIAWLDRKDDYYYDIYAQRYTSDGTTSGSKFKVNDALSIVPICSPSILTYGNGNFIIWWDDSRNGVTMHDIYAQQYSSDGTASGGNFKVNLTVNDRSR